MTLDLGDLVGYLQLDRTGWDKGIDDALRSVDEFGNKTKPRAAAAGQKTGQAFGAGLVPEAQRAGQKSGEVFGDAIVPEAQRAGEEAGEAAGEGLLTKGRLAAGAAGVAFGLAFDSALDVDAGRDKLAAQLGASAKDSRRYGRIAGELYSGAWGESMDEVNTAIASVITSIDGMDKAGGDRIERLTVKALDFATAFEVDVVRATQVAGVMIDSKLAKNGTRAFDLLTKASQKVPVALREDLLDATEEYSQFFNTLGYSGKETFALLVDASAKGMYGIDKAGDAIKEFTIRSTDMSESTELAYERMGFNHEVMTRKILAGGDSARKATQDIIDGLLDIEDPAKQSQTALALFGTPLEDLNVKDIPDFLRSLKGTSDAMDGVSGASKRMGDTLNDNAGARIESFKRTMKTQLVNFLADEVIPVVEDDVLPAVERFSAWFKDEGAPALSDFHDDLKPVLETTKDLVGWLNDLPKPAKYAGLVALLGGIGAMKVRGGALGGDSGILGTVGKVLNLAKPVPVYVTNQGWGDGGLPGGAGGGKVAGALKWAGGIGLGLSGYAALNEGMHATGAVPDRVIWTPFGPVDTQQYKDAAGWFQGEQAKGHATMVGRFDTLISKAGEFGDELDLVGGKKVRPDLTVPGLPQAHRDLQRFFDLEIEAGRPITPYVSLTGVEAAQQQIATLIHDIHAIPSIGDHALPYVSGGGTSSGTSRGGGKHGGDGKTPKTGGVQISIDKVMAHDYGDFMQQTQRRAQQAALGGY